MYRAYKGFTNMTGDTARAISDATGGEVTVDDLTGGHSASGATDSRPPSAL